MNSKRSKTCAWLVVAGLLLSRFPVDASGQTNTYWATRAIDPSIYQTPYRISLFNPQNGEDGARAWSQTKSLFIYGLGVLGVLFAMPEDLTGWDRDADVFGKWWKNVREGPEWDRNNWAYNYVGHTYSGGVYYQVARKSGYRQWDAFFYTFMMSTFYWEYGVESLAEVPSIQDLAVTPLLGWVYGEWAYQTEIGIRDNDDRVLGSRILGGISLAVLDPIDAIGCAVNRLAGRNWVKAGYGYFSYTAIPTGKETDHTVYLNVSIPIGGHPEPDRNEAQRIPVENAADPVTSGIVGISIGPGHALLDEGWGVEDAGFTKITLGLYFTPRFSSRFAYARGEPKEIATGKPVTYENYSLDAQYYLNAKHAFRPFISAGFGEQLWDERLDRKTFQWNAGFGMHWQFHRKWALGADWINYYSPGRDTYEQHISAGLVFRFGQGEQDPW